VSGDPAGAGAGDLESVSIVITPRKRGHSAMIRPLNLELYEALRLTFGDVGIANEGEQASQPAYFPERVYDEDGKTSIRWRGDWSGCGGEYYRVNCMFCSDTRRRLWISHRWGEPDPRTGREMTHLAYCYNEQCLAGDDRQAHENRERLYDLVYPLGVPRRRRLLVRRRPRDQPVEPKVFTVPDGVVPLEELSPEHPAVAYLRSRGFDPAELAARWRVGYCHSSRDAVPALFRRIFIPIHDVRPRFGTDSRDPVVLAGWQARIVGEHLGGASKYLSALGMSKSRLLYGLPEALEAHGPAVVVEGPTDVWRLGPGAVALLGKSLSRRQWELLLSRFAGRPLVVLLDADARDEAGKIRQLLLGPPHARAKVDPVVIARLPEGRQDVGECTRAEAWAAVADALGRPIERLGLREVPASITAVPGPQP
jgi:hypothetical protein